MVKRIPLYFLTGFLGSGKTTVLKYLLTQLPDKKVGVIQNEFGKLSIDGDVLRNDDITMIELSRGSIFCSCLQLSFVEALVDMAKQPLDLVFVESSGWGDPSNATEILEGVEVLAPEAYDYRGTICLVDGLNYPEQLSETETALRQVQYAQLALLSKTDLIDEEQKERVIRLIREENPEVEILPIQNGIIPIEILEAEWTTKPKKASSPTSNREETKPKTISLNYEGAISRTVLESILQEISEDTFRIKGFGNTDEGWMKIDAVESKIDFIPEANGEESRLVFISKVGPKVIRTIDQVWKAKTDHPMQLKN
ncbi:MAG: GTP-binding protein [Tissierellia bacterium]|nr:GTP-binding protein [Tissierellia bacterium]